MATAVIDAPTDPIEAFLVDTVRDFLEPALREGDAALVVATLAHRREFDTALGDAGIDVRLVSAVRRQRAGPEQRRQKLVVRNRLNLGDDDRAGLERRSPRRSGSRRHGRRPHGRRHHPARLPQRSRRAVSRSAPRGGGRPTGTTTPTASPPPSTTSAGDASPPASSTDASSSATSCGSSDTADVAVARGDATRRGALRAARGLVAGAGADSGVVSMADRLVAGDGASASVAMDASWRSRARSGSVAAELLPEEQPEPAARARARTMGGRTRVSFPTAGKLGCFGHRIVRGHGMQAARCPRPPVRNGSVRTRLQPRIFPG